MQISFVTLCFFHSSPAATAVISLAFGRYILEPFFMQCEIPELAIKLITAVGISKYPILGFREEERWYKVGKKKKNQHTEQVVV